MMTVIAIVHMIFCLLLIALVLLQDPKNGGAGAVFGGGGGTNSLLGATGAVTFLTRLTRYSAVVFGITCLILTLLSRQNVGSVLDSAPANASGGAARAPTAPAPGKAVGDSAIPAAGTPGATAPAAPAAESAPKSVPDTTPVEKK
jgi:preprotein translocase subunit SecG